VRERIILSGQNSEFLLASIKQQLSGSAGEIDLWAGVLNRIAFGIIQIDVEPTVIGSYQLVGSLCVGGRYS